MKVVVVGGKLQGTEAVYLAKKAGWQVTLVDRHPAPLARDLCDKYIQVDVSDETAVFTKIIKTADLVIPACENREALNALKAITAKADIPLAFDSTSYDITSSKLKSDMLFVENHIPSPSYWPDCTVPLIVKPSDLAGSVGVKKIHDYKALNEFNLMVGANVGNWVIQEFLEGPSYSLEVIGCRDKILTFQPTEIVVDEGYDCKRVIAPGDLSSQLKEELQQIAVKLAKVLNLTGIMDIEVIYHGGKLKVLEIDARLPSQTPTAVYHSTGT
ncbi:MAG: 3-methylornithine--L-lysine ligase PylC, partial [Bacillota bacterium]|nr:3-methylornithine--L-lysine ligase PylC [Bacillota bacterium]